MFNINVPSFNSLFQKEHLIQAVQYISQYISDWKNESDGEFSQLFVDEDALFTNTISTEQKKQAALMQVLMLEQMYGYTSSTSENPEYTYVIMDSEDKILAGKKVDGTLVLFGEEYPE